MEHREYAWNIVSVQQTEAGVGMLLLLQASYPVCSQRESCLMLICSLSHNLGLPDTLAQMPGPR